MYYFICTNMTNFIHLDQIYATLGYHIQLNLKDIPFHLLQSYETKEHLYSPSILAKEY